MNLNKSQIGGLLLLTFSSVGCLKATVDEPNVCDTQPLSFPISAALQSAVPPALLSVASNDVSTLCNSGNLADLEAATGVTLPSSFTLPVLTTSQTFNFSGTLSSISDVTNTLNVMVNQLELSNEGGSSGPLALVSNLQVTIVSADGGTPQLLANYSAPDAGNGSELKVNVDLTGSQILSDLEAGPVTLTFTISTMPVTWESLCDLAEQTSLQTNVQLCIGATGTFDKKL
jgi:hypothetical protein